MTTPTCSVKLTRFPRNWHKCGKPAITVADGQGLPLYLCKYHTTRCHQGHQLIFFGKDHEPMAYDPTQGWINPYMGTRISHPADFLPDDCWKVILNHLPKDDQYLMKFTCKTWAQIIGNKCMCPDLLHAFSDSRFYCLVDYLGVENIGNIDKFSSLRNNRYPANIGDSYFVGKKIYQYYQYFPPLSNQPDNKTENH